jgi:hypothetical protein
MKLTELIIQLENECVKTRQDKGTLKRSDSDYDYELGRHIGCLETLNAVLTTLQSLDSLD